jgi:hypothetical protein
MTQTAKHSPTPWQDNDAGLIYGQVAGDNDEAPFVCDVCDNQPGYTEREKANAALIVRAVNSHPDLLEALELCVDCLDELARLDDGTPSISALNMAREAIAKATA